MKRCLVCRRRIWFDAVDYDGTTVPPGYYHFPCWNVAIKSQYWQEIFELVKDLLRELADRWRV